jgi:competence protein ComEC
MGIGILIGLTPYSIYGAYLLALLSALLFRISKRYSSLTVRLSSGICFWIAIGWICAFFKVMYFSSTPILRSQPPKVFTATVLNAEYTHYGIRLTLQDTNLQDKVRLTYRRKKPIEVHVGDKIEANVKLMPHKRALYPGGFNFREKNKYEGITATGAVLSDPIIINPSQKTSINSLRQSINNTISTLLSGQTAMIAKALITGEKTGLTQSTRDSYIKAGIAHILAISGLHLTLIAGLVFFVLRRLMCFIPFLIHRFDTKKVAAIFSTIIVFGYVIISGASVPTTRAFIMFCVLMIGILINRQALSVRMIMTAAIGVLIIKPESILMPGFHLSFSAVLALIAFYENNQQTLSNWMAQSNSGKRAVLYIAGILLTSLIASFATLPFSIYHFHQFSITGIFANLLVIPLMSFWIMPNILLFLLTGASFCLKWAAIGIDWMTKVSVFFANLPGSEIFVPQLPKYSLVLMGLSIIWLCVWWGWVRWLGGIFYIAAFLPLLWIQKPLVLISEDAKLVGINTGINVSLSSTRAKSFVSQIWAESLGYNPNTNTTWHKDLNVHCDNKKNCVYKTKEATVAYLKNLDNLQEYCEKSDILISQQPLKKMRNQCLGPKAIVDRFDVWRNGSYIIFKQGNIFISLPSF